MTRSGTAVARSRSFQDVQHCRGFTKELKSAAGGGNVLVVTGSKAKVVAQLVVSSTEPGGRSGTLEPAHRSVSAFQAAVVLFQSIVLVSAGPIAPILSPPR